MRGTATIGLLADMIEGRESTPWHLKRVWARRGTPADVADTTLRNIAIGSLVASHPQSGEFIGPSRPTDPQPALKAAVADICADQKRAVVARALGRSGEPAAPTAGSLPVILAEEDFEPSLRNGAGLQLLKLAPENPPPHWPVSQRVNSSKAPVEIPR